MVEPFPDKPKRLHGWTYLRLLQEHQSAGAKAWVYFDRRMERSDRFLADKMAKMERWKTGAPA